MSKLKRDDAGDWKYETTSIGSYPLEIEWARTRRKEIVLNIGGNRCWVAEEDFEDVIEAMREALQTPCTQCGGTGKERSE